MGETVGFNFISPCWLSSHLSEKRKKREKKKRNVNCYGNKLMFWAYSFHYRKWSIWKLYTENGHTKFPNQTLLILASSSFPSPVAKPGPKCHTFPSQPLSICPWAEPPWEQPPFSPSTAPVNWVTCSGQAPSVGKNWTEKSEPRTTPKTKPTVAHGIYVFVYN